MTEKKKEGRDVFDIALDNAPTIGGSVIGLLLARRLIRPAIAKRARLIQKQDRIFREWDRDADLHRKFGYGGPITQKERRAYFDRKYGGMTQLEIDALTGKVAAGTTAGGILGGGAGFLVSRKSQTHRK